MSSARKLRVGDWVEVRSKDEIVQTLDQNGQLDGLPFMPEMFAFCGRRFRVYKRAHKTCDTVFPVRGRRMANAVHLETRCDGQAHGGCQAGCLIFWKTAWLKPVNPVKNGEQPSPAVVPLPSAPPTGGNSPEARVWAATRVSGQANEPDPAYMCQATQLPYATASLDWWDFRQYFEDFDSGNVGLWRMLCAAVHSAYYHLSDAGIGLGRLMRGFYRIFRPLWGGPPWPRKAGPIPIGKSTPEERLDLQPGELVRVKSHEEILRTLNTAGINRGMAFDKEMVPYCGGTYRVLKRVTKILNERTGKMQNMKTPCIILASVVCQSRYSDCRLFCPRSIYPYWREIWLERVGGNAVSHPPRRTIESISEHQIH